MYLFPCRVAVFVEDLRDREWKKELHITSIASAERLGNNCHVKQHLVFQDEFLKPPVSRYLFCDDSCIFADASIITQATDVLAEHTEGVLVPHHQIRHGTTRSAIVFQESVNHS